MTYILNIETATHICSVSLSKDGETIDLIESHEDRTHAELLSVFIEKILSKNKILPKELSAVAVSEGPGSYTGLRIGVSVVKGLCYGLKIPLISVSTLKAMANGAREEVEDDALLCPMIDARRMEVYTAIYDKQLNLKEKIQAKIIDSDSFRQQLSKQKIVFFGTGSEKCRTEIQDKNAVFREKEYISSQNISSLSYEKFLKSDFENMAYFEPFYLKEFQAIKSKKSYF